MLRPLSACIVAVLLAALPVLGQETVLYGSACSGLFDPPQISFSGTVVPGGFGSVHLSGARPSGLVVLHAGTRNDQTLGGQPLPIDLSIHPVVPAGCSQYTSADLGIFIFTALPDGTLKMDFPVDTSLPTDLYFQWAVVEQIDPLSITLSQGLHVSILTNSNLHVVMLTPDVAVDYDEDGSEIVLLDGSDSHTHQVGHALVEHTWKEGLTTLAEAPVASVPLAVGDHEVSLRIRDDNTPSHTLLDKRTIGVVTPDSVPGIGARYHDAGGGDPALLLDAPPAHADFAEALNELRVEDGGGTVGGSPFPGSVMVRLTGRFSLPTAGLTDVQAIGGADRRLLVDGQRFAGGTNLAAGPHEVDARFAVDSLAGLPLTVTVSQGGQVLDDLLLVHDVKAFGPVIHTVNPALGSSSGGNAVVLEGRGFFPSDQVVLHWGGLALTEADNLSITESTIAFTAPPHAAGSLPVSVQTPQGASNTRTFTYSDTGPVPVSFTAGNSVTLAGPTSGDWGPDGRYYVTSIDGTLHALTLSEDLVITAVDSYPGVSNEVNFNSLGLTFNPFDPPDPVRVYVSHALISADGGGEVTAPSTYHGQVSVLSGPDFDTPVPVVTGLPQPNTAHEVNGLQFDNNGDLLILVGSCTNAGVPALPIGDLPESPLSAALLKAETSRPDFSGAVTYIDADTRLPNDDQRSGQTVDVAPGSHVRVQAAGLRNPYDLVFTTSGRLYGTDNGPNATFGPQSTGPDTAGADAEGPDEILLLEAGNYYGHPNRSRGRGDPRQNVYHGPDVPSLPGVFSQALTIMASSVDGITEYRSQTFDGQMTGELIVQKWVDEAFRIRLSDNGRAVESVLPLLPATGALDVSMTPGGGLVFVDYTGNAIHTLDIADASAGGMRALDITPWRAPDTGGAPFVIGGEGFGTLGDTTVTVGGLQATVQAVTPRRITGLLPAQPSPTTALLDVVVGSAGEVDVIPGAFRFLLTPAGTEPGRWEAGENLPAPLGEIAGAVLDGTLYLLSHDAPETYAHDVLGGGWTTLAARPYVGGGHAVVTAGDLLYVVGGHSGGSMGRVQIYDHHDDLWTEGAPMPWMGGGVSAAVIDGRIYAAGGHVGPDDVDDCAVYDPASDTWTVLASLPANEGRRHAAAGTDGSRLFVFGGAGGADSVQIYDPDTNTWQTSDGPGAVLTPLPVGKGGTGSAVWWRDDFYVFGGTDDATVFDRVDVYDPAANTWRLDAPMPTPRHDVFPLLFQGRVFIAGGSTLTGHGHSDVVEIFTRQ